MPDKFKVPEARQEKGVDSVDVMSFLNVKRAEPLTKKTSGENGMSP